MIPDRILRKIERCLALSRSANEHEAGTALRQAQHLMDEYGVSEIDVAASTIDRVAVKSPTGRKPPLAKPPSKSQIRAVSALPHLTKHQEAIAKIKDDRIAAHCH